ncbi:hypothetical protein ABZW30_12790 [Kitasatospora sp. NPDC004669]|uniref:hypothetical protein n=1 Tax=Kitasatospora sp. NPDC004669 TaxID=3154555 RepID=UPI0033BE58DE
MWWRFGRAGRHSLIEALDNPDNRAAYDLRQQAREQKADQAHRELMRTLACADCGGQVPEQESTWEYGLHGQWTRRPGGRCYPCHQEHEERQEKAAAKARKRLEQARETNAALRPCWTCRGSIGGKAGSPLELDENAGPGRLECPQCAGDREVEELGLLVLPAPTKRELVAELAFPFWVVMASCRILASSTGRAAGCEGA